MEEEFTYQALPIIEFHQGSTPWNSHRRGGLTWMTPAAEQSRIFCHLHVSMRSFDCRTYGQHTGKESQCFTFI